MKHLKRADTKSAAVPQESQGTVIHFPMCSEFPMLAAKIADRLKSVNSGYIRRIYISLKHPEQMPGSGTRLNAGIVTGVFTWNVRDTLGLRNVLCSVVCSRPGRVLLSCSYCSEITPPVVLPLLPTG